MAQGTITFELDEPPERVFDYVADVRNEAEWSKDIVSVEKEGDGPVAEGTVFDTRYRGFGPMRIAIVEHRRPERLVMDCEGPRMRMRFAMDVAPAAAGSTVTFHVEMRPQGVLRPLAPLLAMALPRELAKRPAQFRAALSRA